METKRELSAGEDVRHPIMWLCVVTALAAILRLYRVGSDLWSDEITTVVAFQGVSPFDVIAVYKSPNNHVLNTLLVQAMVSAFGPAEWAIRLPAVILGIACIPAVYALARVALGQRESLFAALLLSVSYHHIFFSQNARGYTGLLFWSMLGTTVFLRGLARDRARDWVVYVASMFLAVATVLNGLFVIAGHVLSFAVACAIPRWRRRFSTRLVRRLLVAWAVLGLLCLLFYASVLAQAGGYLGSIYRTPSVGYAPFSVEHVRELVRGVSVGFGGATILAAVPVVLVMGFGFVLFLRRHTLYAITLVAPLFATAGFLLARNLNFAPRFFLWGLPVAWIFAVAAAASLGDWLASRSGAVALPAQKLAEIVPFFAVAVLAALSLSSLPAYYRTPKQASRGSVDWVLAHRRPGDLIVATPPAKWALRFYGPRRGLAEGRSFFVVDTAFELQKLEDSEGPQTVWLLTTFRRAFALERPELDRYIREHYREQKTFPATIGDGDITIWTRELYR